jgi:hypothetical protein
MELRIGDKVHMGMHLGIVTDVGTVLVQVATDKGLRMVCPWEVVKTRDGWLPTRPGRHAEADLAVEVRDRRLQKALCHCGMRAAHHGDVGAKRTASTR